MPANIFENFENICLEVYELESALFLTAPGLSWEAALKKANVKLVLLTDVLLIVEKSIKL